MAVQASLVYTAADGNKQDLVLRAGEDTTIGRHPNCSLTISQPSVSRRHARLWFDQGVWFVEDLQSSNGTFVNNRRINRAQLTEGDELRCGDFLLTYMIEEKTRAVRTSERSEKAPPAPPSPQVSNRATVGLESPPPIPEAPRLSSPHPPASAPAAPSRSERNYDNQQNRVAELEASLESARRTESQVKEDLSACREQLEVTRSELSASRDEINRLNDQLQNLRQERDAARNDLENLEDRNSQLESEMLDLKRASIELNETIDRLRNEEDVATNAGVAIQSDEIERLEALLEAKNKDIASLQQNLEEMHLNNQDAPKAPAGGSGASPEVTSALSEQSSELRVALKAASGFVQEVKDVFKSVASIDAADNAPKTVLDLQDTFEEIGGMDPVNSLEAAFDKMERTARKLRRLSKSL